jgi:hypothetical protein
LNGLLRRARCLAASRRGAIRGPLRESVSRRSWTARDLPLDGRRAVASPPPTVLPAACGATVGSDRTRTLVLLPPAEKRQRLRRPEWPATSPFLRSGGQPGRPRLSNHCPMTQTHYPTARVKKTCKCRSFRERLKGFEPSTFCMASRTWRDADCADIPANERFCRRGVAADNPRFLPRNHGGLGTESGLSDGPNGSASPRQLA